MIWPVMYHAQFTQEKIEILRFLRIKKRNLRITNILLSVNDCEHAGFAPEIL